MRNGTTYHDLQALLLERGFVDTAQAKDGTRFQHSVTGTILLFRPHQANERVSDRDMHVVRRQLVDNGLIDPAAFDQFLQQATA